MKNILQGTSGLRSVAMLAFSLFIRAAAAFTPDPCPTLTVEEIRGVSCPGAHDGLLKVFVSGGAAPYYISVNDQPAIISNSGRLQLVNLTARDYRFSVEDKAGCTFSTTVSLPDAPELRLDLGPDIELVEGQQVLLIPSINFAASSVQWTPTSYLDEPASLSPNAAPTETTTYYLTVTSLNGCAVTDSITLLVTPLFRIYIPNAFSPNRDGLNDHFMVYGEAESAIVRRLAVFDRWGSVMYEAKDLPLNAEDQGWDGSFRGQPASEGAYLYFAEVERADGEVRYLQGTVTLIR